MSYTIWQDHLAHGAQVRIEAYPDRLRVTNPGGLHGEISRTRLFSEPLTSSRNSHLARRTSTDEDTRGGARYDPSGSAQATPKDGGDRREVELTELARRSPLNRWRLTNPPDTR